jgi:hypothetical protein
MIEQLQQNYDISIPSKGDFFIDENYLFEVGGKNKSFK